MRLEVALAMGLAATACGPANGRSPRTVQFDVSRPDALADVYDPPAVLAPRPRQAVLVIHGGGWQYMSRHDVAPLARAIAERGLVAVAPDYRLSPVAPWPAQLRDCEAAVAWVASNAESLGVDAAKIGVAGGSAGGHLAAMLAFGDRSRVRVFCSASGESDLTRPAFLGQEECLRVLFGREPTREDLVGASPLFRVRSDVVAFLVHSIGDPMMRVEQTDLLAAELRRVGARVSYARRHGRVHDPSDDERACEAIADFFARNL